MPAQALITGQGDARRTLIVVFLRGAADGLALVPPLEDEHYHRARPRLGIAKRDAVRLDDRFGLHPKLQPLERAWREGELAIVHACGIEDDTRSHFEAQDLMEHGGVVAGGWLGRYLRTRPAAASGALTCVAVGKALPECLLGAPAVTVMQNFDDFVIGGRTPAFQTQLERLYAMQRGQLGEAARDTFDALVRIEAMRTTVYQPEHGAAYGRDEFSTGLSQLARLIKAGVGLEAASIDLPGWDSHFAQQGQVETLAARLATGLEAFRRDLGARMTTTTVVVMTEFGRTVEENSAFGTDHGRGSAMFVLGGGVQGGRIHGAWRGLSPDVLERRGVLEGYGDLPVLNNYRNVLAPILTRQGTTAEGLRTVFPGYSLEPFSLYG
ncbi:DUF1501 domain-containing protein [Horticoccus sp. 23ND18S-11]|uniref:DUF1501 domain-containing protein n=1 Tax=Horticoccus sp. 23ND18S-11 TaxID=3391832 RepID=UPI0039C9BB65